MIEYFTDNLEGLIDLVLEHSPGYTYSDIRKMYIVDFYKLVDRANKRIEKNG